MRNANYNLPGSSDISRVLTSDAGDIPSFTPIMGKLVEVCNDPMASMADISLLVGTDVGISAKILGIANSAYYGLRHKVSAISDAVVLLGLDEVKKICLGVTLYDSMILPGREKQFDRTFFWRHCLCVASLSQSIARQVGYENSGEAYTAGLLHDFGKILFDRSGRVNYSEFISGTAGCTGPLIDGEQDLMGMGHDDLGAYFCLSWQLPDSLCLVVRYHHHTFAGLDLVPDQARLIAIVSLANFLSWTQGMGSLDVINLPVLQPEVKELLDFSNIDFKQVTREMDQEIERTARFYRFAFPTADQFRENLLQASLVLSSINADHYYNAPENIQSQAAHDSITASLTAPHRSLDPRAIITNTLTAVCDDFSFERIYVMRMKKPLRILCVTECLDRGRWTEGLAGVRISMDRQAGGFIRCLRKREPVLIQAGTTGERKALQALGVSECLIVPFCSHNKVLGILGMDYGDGAGSFTPQLFFSISIVAHELGRALENASAYKEARTLSLRDGLTGLLNRMAVDRLLARAFKIAREENACLSVVMIDVDYFKKFNDRFGHQAGDSVLRLLSKTLNTLSRPLDHVGRYGGEEFIVVLTRTPLEKALVYAERIRKEIQGLGTVLADRFPGLPLTVSIGVSQYQKGVESEDELVSAADKALYQAKNAGRNRVVAARQS